jgi:glutamine amidotransferase
MAEDVVIVDYGMGNLFSVAAACEAVGATSKVTNAPEEIEAAAALILPGVGAFGDAMTTLALRGLDSAIQRAVARGTPLLAICLGMQLLLDKSSEHGRHAGLGLVGGRVLSLRGTNAHSRRLKVPQVGWFPVQPTAEGSWEGTPLRSLEPGTPMYFVHSFHCVLEDPARSVAVASFGGSTYCAAFRVGPIFACQFHPERSGRRGLEVYREFITAAREEARHP